MAVRSRIGLVESKFLWWQARGKDILECMEHMYLYDFVYTPYSIITSVCAYLFFFLWCWFIEGHQSFSSAASIYPDFCPRRRLGWLLVRLEQNPAWG